MHISRHLQQPDDGWWGVGQTGQRVTGVQYQCGLIIHNECLMAYLAALLEAEVCP